MMKRKRISSSANNNNNVKEDSVDTRENEITEPKRKKMKITNNEDIATSDNIKSLEDVDMEKVINSRPENEIRGILLEGLECPICRTIFNGDILMCPSGHSLCIKCIKKLPKGGKKCPMCAKVLAHGKMKRNLALESIISSIRIECPNSVNGCNANLKRDMYDVHMKECDYRVVTCNGSEFGCKWSGINLDYLKHKETCAFYLTNRMFTVHREKIYKRLETTNKRIDKLNGTLNTINKQLKSLKQWKDCKRATLKLDELSREDKRSVIFCLMNHVWMITLCEEKDDEDISLKINCIDEEDDDASKRNSTYTFFIWACSKDKNINNKNGDMKRKKQPWYVSFTKRCSNNTNVDNMICRIMTKNVFDSLFGNNTNSLHLTVLCSKII